MQAKEKGSPKFNKGHQELLEMKSRSLHICLQDQSEQSSLLWKDLSSLVVMRTDGNPTAVLVSTALQIPAWTTAEMTKPQLCLEGSFFTGSVWQTVL